jgi:hypothetical protein
VHDGNFNVGYSYSIGNGEINGSAYISLNPDVSKKDFFIQIEEQLSQCLADTLKDLNYPLLKVWTFDSGHFNDIISCAFAKLRIEATLNITGNKTWTGKHSIDLSSAPSEFTYVPLNFYFNNELLSNWTSWGAQGVKNNSELRVEEDTEFLNSNPHAFITIFNHGKVQLE